MGKLGKIIGILVVLVIVVVVGLVVFVRQYLTDERIIALVVPPTENILGRTVSIGDIDVSLLSGIAIHDFSIKEADGTSDFLSAKAFVLDYDLLPLLQKKLMIKEIRLDGPVITINRDQSGAFNFASLAILADKQSADKPAPSASPITLPFVLTVDGIAVNQARLIVRDAMGQIPDTDAVADLKVLLNISADLAIDYRGSMKFGADAMYGDVKPHLDGSADFDANKLGFRISIDLDPEKLQVDGSVVNYGKSPDLILNLGSEKLNIDNLLAMTASLPRSEEEEKAPVKEDAPQAPLASSLPPGFAAQGSVNIGEVLCNKLVTRDVALHYIVRNGFLFIDNFSTRVYGGKILSNLELDLNKVGFGYKGNLAVQSLQASELTNTWAKKAANIISGTVEMALNFTGAGTVWESARKNLAADADFSVNNFEVKETPITSTAAALLQMPELSNLSFDNVNGKLNLVKGGVVNLDTILKGKDLNVETKGNVSLDGDLDMPLALTLSPVLTEKLVSRTSFAKYLTGDKQNATLQLLLTGTAGKPKLTIDQSAVQEQVKDAVKQKAVEKIGDVLGQKTGAKQGGEPVQQLFKGLFGR